MQKTKLSLVHRTLIVYNSTTSTSKVMFELHLCKELDRLKKNKRVSEYSFIFPETAASAVVYTKCCLQLH